MIELEPDEVYWRQIYLTLRKRIETGVYPERTKLPSIVELEQEFLHSRGTIRTALALLSREQFIRAIQGKATFVRLSTEWSPIEDD